MVRLVTSRLHRCYSSRSLSRSNAIERMTFLLHVVASASESLTGDDWGFHFVVSPSASPIPSILRTCCITLLLLVHLLDLTCALTSHVKFYRSNNKSSSSSRRNNNSPTNNHNNGIGKSSFPTTSTHYSNATTTSSSSSSTSPALTDTFISMLYFSASCMLLLSACHYHRYYNLHPSVLPPPSEAQEYARHIQVRSTLYYGILLFIASTLNVIYCLPFPSPYPSQSILPVWLSRMHMFVTTIFHMATMSKLGALVVLLYAVPDPPMAVVRLAKQTIQIADIIILISAFVNFIRVIKLQQRTRFWVLHEMKRSGGRRVKNGNGEKQGMFSWFGKKSEEVLGSDEDSDFADEYDMSFDADDDMFKQDSKRLAP